MRVRGKGVRVPIDAGGAARGPDPHLMPGSWGSLPMYPLTFGPEVTRYEGPAHSGQDVSWWILREPSFSFPQYLCRSARVWTPRSSPSVVRVLGPPHPRPSDPGVPAFSISPVSHGELAAPPRMSAGVHLCPSICGCSFCPVPLRRSVAWARRRLRHE